MVSDEKKIKTNPAPKNELPSKDKSPSGVDTSNVSKDKSTSGAGTSNAAEGGKNADPVSYSRGEGQKPVSQAYRDNWNAIFARKKKR